MATGRRTIQLVLATLLLFCVQLALYRDALEFGYSLDDWRWLARSSPLLASELAPFWLHAVNILVAGGLATLALLLLHDLVKSVPAALLGALAFSLHPGHVDAVVSLHARGSLVLALACLLAIASWVRYRFRGQRRWFSLALAAHLVTATSPPVCVLLLCLIVLVDLFVFTGASRSLRLDFAELARRRWQMLPFALIATHCAWQAVGSGRELSFRWGSFLALTSRVPEAALASGTTAAAALCSGIAVLAAVAGRSVPDCYREGRLALLGVALLALACLPKDLFAVLVPGTDLGLLAAIALGMLWASAGLAAARSGSATGLRLGVLGASFAVLVALFLHTGHGRLEELRRGSHLAARVEAATRSVLPRLERELAAGARVDSELAPVDGPTLMAMCAVQMRAKQSTWPGALTGRSSGRPIVLRWQCDGWQIR